MCVGFAVTSLSSIIFWIKKRKKTLDTTGKYTATQILGILGIIVFLLPTFLLILFNLSRGILILVLFLFRLIHLPEQLVSIIISCFFGILFSLSFVSLFIVGRYIWPKKKVAAGSEQTHFLSSQ